MVYFVSCSAQRSSWHGGAQAGLEGAGFSSKTPSFTEFVKNTAADVAFLLEHRLRGALFRHQVARLQRWGWRAYGAQCIGTDTGRPSGGTFVIARKHLDTWLPPGAAASVFDGRVSRCFLRSSSVGVYAGYSIYLKDSEGPSHLNSRVLDS
eukprot:8402558-Pyramimonas_sp.AAC.1